jgi:hypothetical protein
VILWIGLALFGFLFVNRFFQPTYAILATELILIGLLGRTASSRTAGSGSISNRGNLTAA